MTRAGAEAADTPYGMTSCRTHTSSAVGIQNGARRPRAIYDQKKMVCRTEQAYGFSSLVKRQRRSGPAPLRAG